MCRIMYDCDSVCVCVTVCVCVCVCEGKQENPKSLQLFWF